MIFQIDSDLNITTSRKPSQKTRRFVQFIRHYFNFNYITRGKTSFNKIINRTKQEKTGKLVVITETKGNPSSINIYDVNDTSEALYSIYCTVSLPVGNSRINVDSGEILVINKSKSLSFINRLFTEIKTCDKIRKNCVIIRDDPKEEILATATFTDKNGEDTGYKLFIRKVDIRE